MTTTLWVEPALGTVSGGLRYNQQLRQALREMGCEAQVLSLPPESFESAEGAAAIRRQTQQLNPDLVIVDGLIGSAHPELFRPGDAEQGAGQGAGHGARRQSLADVLLMHLPAAVEAEAQGGADPQVAAAEQASVAEASHVVAVSRWAAAQLRRRYRRQDIRVAVPGAEVPVSPARSSADSPHSDNQSGITFACVAGLNPLKNHRLLITALEPLQDHRWRLVLAGPGAETDYGRQLLQDMAERLPGRVDHQGVLSPAGVAGLWKDTDLLLLPSVVETYGMVITEACAHGVPSFVSAGTGAEEALAGAGAALAAAPSRWTAALADYLTDATARARLREAARRRRAELPSWRAAAEIFAGLGRGRTGIGEAPIG